MTARRSLPRSDLYPALRTTAWVAVVALLGVAPHLYYLTSIAFADRLRERFTDSGLQDLIRAELASVALVVLVVSSVGALFAKRYGLVGVGSVADLRRARLWVLAVAPALSLATYLLFGRAIAARVPGYYPEELYWALAKALKGALFDEVVARFGMMTILCGIFRRVWLANVLQAAFFTVLAVLGLSFYAVEPTASVYFAVSIAASVGIHLLLGWTYAKYGLVTAMALHFVYGLKFLLHALLT
ncbi:MAG: CPBP family intramembrane metalloprotease [Deltaproteobacteria bacterium]|nr:CPBP family intramembrane metalloprotease [Deltaproteobacteria bacterium]MBW2536808.1 CPBP family intramembrane metalloprotease [Deltaproteobacteria bacterium]